MDKHYSDEESKEEVIKTSRQTSASHDLNQRINKEKASIHSKVSYFVNNQERLEHLLTSLLNDHERSL